jgi:hypothetical protein
VSQRPWNPIKVFNTPIKVKISQQKSGYRSRLSHLEMRQGKPSFFEKKDQKTFVFEALPTKSRVEMAPSSPIREETKVFWSFFSKKDGFLPTTPATSDSQNRSMHQP